MTGVAGIGQGAHVVGKAGEAFQTAFLVEHVVDLGQIPAQGLVQEIVQARVDITAAGAHHQAFEWGQTHAGVAAFTIDHRTGGAAVAQVSDQPAAVLDRYAGQFGGALADVAMAGAVEAVAAYAMLLVQHIRYGVAVSVLGHGLVESGVEHADLRQLGEQIDGGVDAAQVGRIVQRRQLNVGFDAGQGFVGEQRGGEEFFAAMHHAVADAVQVPARGVFHARQDLGQSSLMIGIRHLDAFLAGRALEVDDGFRAADAFGQAL